MAYFPEIIIPWTLTKHWGWCKARIYRLPTTFGIRVTKSTYEPTIITQDTPRLLEDRCYTEEVLRFKTISRLRFNLTKERLSDLLSPDHMRTIQYHIDHYEHPTEARAS